MKEPKKWYDVYPAGTMEGEEELKVFKALCRNKKYTWQSIAQIVQQTKISIERVEEIIEKYASRFDPPLILPHPTNEANWGYWELNKDALKTDNRSISKKDKDRRVDEHLNNGDSSMKSKTQSFDV